MKTHSLRRGIALLAIVSQITPGAPAAAVPAPGARAPTYPTRPNIGPRNPATPPPAPAPAPVPAPAPLRDPNAGDLALGLLTSIARGSYNGDPYAAIYSYVTNNSDRSARIAEVQAAMMQLSNQVSPGALAIRDTYAVLGSAIANGRDPLADLRNYLFDPNGQRRLGPAPSVTSVANDLGRDVEISLGAYRAIGDALANGQNPVTAFDNYRQSLGNQTPGINNTLDGLGNDIRAGFTQTVGSYRAILTALANQQNPYTALENYMRSLGDPAAAMATLQREVMMLGGASDLVSRLLRDNYAVMAGSILRREDPYANLMSYITQQRDAYVSPQQSMAADARSPASAMAGGMRSAIETAAAAARASAAQVQTGLPTQNPANTGRPQTADNTPPRPVPATPDYPTSVRTPEERAAYDRQRAAQLAQADAARQRALEAEYEAYTAQQARLSAQERARLENERARLEAAASAQSIRDYNWDRLVRDSFRSAEFPGWGMYNGNDAMSRSLTDAVWDAFGRNAGQLTVAELESIYANYDPLNTIPPAQSLSSAPNSLSSMFNTRLSSAGLPVRTGTDNYDDPAVQSLYEALYGLVGRRRGPLGPSEDEVQTAAMGDYDLYSDPTGRWGRESGGYLAANLFDNEVDYLQRSIVNGRGGLSALLAQPFNVILSWGDGAYDLDLHMTGPTGLGQTDRFHIYYSAAGSLTSFPFAALIKDCICSAGSEVILTTTLLGGGVYRVSVFNFGDQSANSANLSNLSNATIQIVRGGTAVSQGNGTTIQGGRVILRTNVPNGQVGNTWVAVELDPRTGRITVPRTIVQTQDSAHVR